MDDTKILEWVIQRYDRNVGGEVGKYSEYLWHTMMEHQVWGHQRGHESCRPRGIIAGVRMLTRVHRYLPGEFRMLNLRTLETIYPTHLGM